MKRDENTKHDTSLNDAIENKPQKKRSPLEERENLLSKDLSFSELKTLVVQELSQLDDDEIVGLLLPVLPDLVTQRYHSLLSQENPIQMNNRHFKCNPALPIRSKEDKIVEILKKLDLGQLQNLASDLYQHKLQRLDAKATI